jgi:hypothetical protein
LINEATTNGCRLKSACGDLGIDFKTINRWKISIEDERRGPITTPANKLTEATFDFNVSPPFELNSKKTPSYSTYLWAVTLVVGFIAGMAVRRSGKKDEGKTETK